MGVKVVRDPQFETNAKRWRGSLNGLGDIVKNETDKIGQRVKLIADSEATRWEATRDSLKNLSRSRNLQERMRFFRAKAMAYSLRIYVGSVRFYLNADPDGNYGSVEAQHGAADLIEYGGTDQKIQLGGSGQYLDYPAFSFLRRGMSG